MISNLVLSLMLAVTPAVPAAPAAEHVVILLDASMSMTTDMTEEQTRMDAAKAAIAKVVEGLPDGVPIGLVAFTTASTTEWYHPMGPLDKAKFREGLESIEPGGGTPLGAYIEVAANVLLKARKANQGYGEYRLIVVTDGEAEDPERMDAAAQALLARGVMLDVVGVQMENTHSLARMAQSYRNTEDAGSLEQAVSALLAETGDSASQDGDADAYALASAFSDSSAGPVLRALAGSSLDNSPIGDTAGPPRDDAPSAKSDGTSKKSLYLLAAAIGIIFFFRRGRRRRK
jgi:uncharacterized protein YegL